MSTIVFALAFAGGYAAAITTWPKVKELVRGAQAEALALRERARALEVKLLGGDRD